MQYIFVQLFCAILFSITHSSADIDPLINISGTPAVVNQTDITNSTKLILGNSHAVVTLICRADYPILWMFDYDRLERKYISGVTQWVERKFDNFWDISSYHYEVYFQIRFTIVRKTEYVMCQKVGVPQVKSIIEISPSGDLLSIELVTETIQSQLDVSSSSKRCELQLTVKDRPEGPVWKCETKDGAAGELDFEGCLYGMPCANLFRRIKNEKTCLKILQQNESCLPASRCWQNDNLAHALRPSVVHCSHNGVRRAISYFFSFPPHGLAGNHSLHFNWDDVAGELMLFVDSLPRYVYYIGEKLNITCRISRYYFSFGYRFALQVDDELLLLEPDDYSSLDGITNARVATQSIQLNDTRTNSILCFAPIFNSTGWINKSVSILVKHPTHPYFAKETEVITLQSGAKDINISCEVSGEPTPIIRWHKENSNLGTTTGVNLTIHEVKPDPPSSTMIIMGVIVSVLVLSLLIGLVIACWKIQAVTKKWRELTEDEVKEFRDGTNAIYTNDGNLEIESSPYNNAFEISRESLHINERCILGSGNFGIVRSGVITTSKGKIKVAVKGLKPGAGVIHLKALLTELKIMAHFENAHENIVHLIGAYTGDIAQGDVYVGLELCESSILTLLRSREYNFLDHVNQGKLVINPIESNRSSVYKNLSCKLSTFDLIRWSYEIADGMNFLSLKRVVHGDLAARNVLVTSNSTAKISDFGLARRLVDYNYIKTESCPLPWKWMAIESLPEMKFSTASDVWSFGITMWEIFSLGQTPYPGLAWSVKFVDDLTQGLRLGGPPFATKIIYEIMLNCWEQIARDRPTFTDLMKNLKPLLITNFSATGDANYENTL